AAGRTAKRHAEVERIGRGAGDHQSTVVHAARLGHGDRALRHHGNVVVVVGVAPEHEGRPKKEHEQSGGLHGLGSPWPKQVTNIGLQGRTSPPFSEWYSLLPP